MLKRFRSDVLRPRQSDDSVVSNELARPASARASIDMRRSVGESSMSRALCDELRRRGCNPSSDIDVLNHRSMAFTLFIPEKEYTAGSAALAIRSSYKHGTDLAYVSVKQLENGDIMVSYHACVTKE